MPHYEVAVIGLGAMGSAALFNLARRGVRAIGIEQFEAGHDRGSSHGESRIIRLGYFEHPSYVPLVRSAYENWAALERLTGETIFTRTGIIEAGFPGSPLVAGALASCEQHALEHDRLDAAQIARRFPAFQLPEGYTGLYQSAAGFLRPERAIQLFLAEAERCRAEIRTNTKVLGLNQRGSDVEIVLEAGAIEAGSVVVSAGAWVSELLPALRPHLHLTRQVMCWFEPQRPRHFALGQMPVFIVESPDDAVYGFPMLPGAASFKCASHRGREPIARADAATQGTGSVDEARTRRFLERHMPEGAGPLTAMKTCIYTMTPDEDFIVDTLPGDPRIVIASPCSGHGFKFASVVGEALADLATMGRTPIDLSRFALSRFAVSSWQS